MLSVFRHYVWSKIQDDISKGNVPSKGSINYVYEDEMIVIVSWEIIRNLVTSELDISVFVERLLDDSGTSKAKLDIQLSLPSQNDCHIESTDVNILNWDEVYDAEYESLPEMIRDAWNEK